MAGQCRPASSSNIVPTWQGTEVAGLRPHFFFILGSGGGPAAEGGDVAAAAAPAVRAPAVSGRPAPPEVPQQGLMANYDCGGDAA